MINGGQFNSHIYNDDLSSHVSVPTTGAEALATGTGTDTYNWWTSGELSNLPEPNEPPTGYIGLWTIEDIQKIGNDAGYPLNAKYAVMNDIDASATATWNDGAGFAPIDIFTGTFDGQGFDISGLVINRPTEVHAGLFGGIIDGTVQNIGLVDNMIIGGDIIGGIVGVFTGGIISLCYATGSIIGNTVVGGLVGANSSTTVIANCYATSTVEGNTNVGGLIGQNNGSVMTCYIAGPVTGAHYVGGIVGLEFGTVAMSCYDSTITGQSDTGKGEPRTTAQMQNAATYTGWDFLGVWHAPTTGAYPTLRAFD